MMEPDPEVIERLRRSCLKVLHRSGFDIGPLLFASAEAVLDATLDRFGALRIPEADGDGVLTLFRGATHH